MDILSTPLQTGAFALALVVLFILAMVVRSLLRSVTNDLPHVLERLEEIQTKLDRLPCMTGRACPKQIGGPDDAP